jgi:signal transduction histidine kinase
MSVSALSAHVGNPARLAALQAVALLDTPTEEAFDRLSRLAARFLNAPVALVSLVDAHRQFFKSCVGLPEPWRSRRETPLSHSFCQHNRIAGQPLLIEDARTHPILKDNLAIRDLQVIAYLGIPLVTADGYVLGSFCVIDSKPRRWGQEDVSVLEDLAAAVMTEIQLRTEAAGRQSAQRERDDVAQLHARLQEEFVARTKAEEEQRKLAAQLHQAQKMEAIGQLAGGIAHDLNNLLAPILGYSELLSGDPGCKDNQRKGLHEIQLAGHRARDLVGQLLAFSRKQTLKLTPMNLNDTIERFEQLLRRIIPEDLAIKVVLFPALPPVLADVGQIEQIIMNLAVNATDAMPNGGMLTIETAVDTLLDEETTVPAEGGTKQYVRLSVSDTGCGMDQATCEHVFEPFFSTKGDQGTGLGLATVFGIVQQHHGHIRLSSEPNKGTTFHIYLPVTEAASVKETTNDQTVPDLKGTETILLVEDHEQVRELARAILEQQGYTILAAENGQDALAILVSHEGPVHLLLTDVVMPGMNGRELYEKAARERPGLKVLYLSGYTDSIIVHRGLLDKGIQFVQKPFSIQDLSYKIREVLME